MSDDGDTGDSFGSTWWGQLLIALFFFALAVVIYFYLTNLEEAGGRGRINWIVALVYNFAGKWGSVLLFAIPGLIMAIIGIRTLVVGMGDKDEK